MKYCLSILLLITALAGLAVADDIEYGLCDIRVLYVYDSPDEIDWPTLYYLNEDFGCRIDLLNIQPKGNYLATHNEVKNREIYSHHYFLPDDTLSFDTLFAHLFQERWPDIVIYSNNNLNEYTNTFKSKFEAVKLEDTSLFRDYKAYSRDLDRTSDGDNASWVSLNSQELMARYKNRMQNEIPQIFTGVDIHSMKPSRLVHYKLVHTDFPADLPDVSFLSGFETLRLKSIIKKIFPEGPIEKTYLNYAREYVSSFKAAQRTVGKIRTDFIVKGFKELNRLTTSPSLTGQEYFSDVFVKYLRELKTKAEKITLKDVGVKWDSHLSFRDSPHGPKLKYHIAVSSDGHREVRLSALQFHPFWDTLSVVLDDGSYTITPHQSYVKEFLIDIDKQHLETDKPESLRVSAQISYGVLPIEISTVVPLKETPQLGIWFDPDFYFIPPVARLEVDRVVSSMYWNAFISKPKDFSGKVGINLETPRGVFAGAYTQELELAQGSTLQLIRIPFSVSKLFELGIQHQVIRLYSDNQLIVADTGAIRVASCTVADTINIGFLPDTTGRLEDILRMTSADFEPLTDRTLINGDLSAYDVIVIGSGSFRTYPSLTRIRDRINDFLRFGGSLVIFGQPRDWPQGVLPVSFVPGTEYVSEKEIINGIENARIMSRPFKISTKGLLSSFFKKREANATSISPSEMVFETPSGGSLLSVSRFGQGQIIYCGFPCWR